jgi:hypothetical protein
MRTPWWLSGLLVVLAAIPVQAQEEDENNLPSAPVLSEPEASPPPAIIESSPPPVVIESETVAPAAPVVEVTARPALGVRFFRGTQVRIAQVLDDSPADLAGLHRGDLVVSFNGILPATTDEFIALVANAPVDATSEIVVVRGSERHSIVIEPDAWATVFSEPYVAARFDLDDAPDAPAAVPSPPYYHAPYYWYAPYYYVSNVSPVVVPASWYVPYPYPYPYYYTAYWGYYPAWYYNAYPTYYWPYYWNYPTYWGVAPHPYHHHHHHDHEAPDQDSAGLDSGSTVTVRYVRP